MYYEEKLICGILHWRGSPDGEWLPMSQERLTALVLELRQQRVMNTPMPYVNPAWQQPIVTCKVSDGAS